MEQKSKEKKKDYPNILDCANIRIFPIEDAIGPDPKPFANIICVGNASKVCSCEKCPRVDSKVVFDELSHFYK